MKRVIDNVPLISAGLIFIGYLNYEFFYSHFDIDISSYLTSTELIFSFLPLTLPFTFVFVGLVVLVSLEFALSRRKYPNASKPKPPFYHLISVKAVFGLFLIEIKKFKAAKTVGRFITVVFCLFFFVFSVLTMIFRILFIGYILSSLSNTGMQFIEFSYLIWLGGFWVLLLYASVERKRREDPKTNYPAMANLIVAVILIALLRYKNREDALAVLGGKPEHYACIMVNNELVETDSTIVFVGKTADYIFLHDRTQHRNQIIKMADVTDYKTEQISRPD